MERVGEVIISTLAAMDGVAGVYCLHGSELCQVFTIIDDIEDEAIYDAIYEQERSLIGLFHGVHFDFNVIPRRGRPMREIVGSDVKIGRRTESSPSCPSATSI